MLQRLRDPVHDLIEFDQGGFEKLIWSLLDRPEFQRLRRIRQLGFSDLVFPGATHSRFAHSLGVFHTARTLRNVLARKLNDFDSDRAEVAVCAALVHDLGHGPFSHAFEAALGEEGKHEEWTAKIIRDTPIAHLLNNYRAGFSEQVASVFQRETLPDIYSSIVSSQFDADRLDYMRRDRYMTGTKLAGIDYDWLISTLEVGEIEVGIDEQKYDVKSTFVLGPKALWAGESYVLSLFHLYPAVYLHKTTRGAEKIFSALMRALQVLVSENRPAESGLPDNHPLIVYLKTRSLSSYLDLDDAVVWGALPLLSESKDPIVKDAAVRLRCRQLYKAFDVHTSISGGRAGGGGESEQRVRRFTRLLGDRIKADQSLINRILIDRFERDPYKQKGYDTPHAIGRIHIMQDGRPIDLAHVSTVVGALRPFEIYRLYVAPDDDRARQVVEETIVEAKK